MTNESKYVVMFDAGVIHLVKWLTPPIVDIIHLGKWLTSARCKVIYSANWITSDDKGVYHSIK